MAVVFVGSSQEGEDYAESVGRVLQAAGSSAMLWWSSDAFPANESLLTSLHNLLDKVDGAILIVTPDDTRASRGHTRVSGPSNNVLLEYGLFAGRLGRSRVAIVRVGETPLPSDLDGVKTMRVRLLREQEDTDTYDSLEMKKHIEPWANRLTSNDGSRLAEMIRHSAPTISQDRKVKLKADILSSQLNPDSFVRQPPGVLAEIIERYVRAPGHHQTVGFTVKTSVESYLNLADVPPSSDDERCLVDHFASYIADWILSKDIRPTALAISKPAATRVLHAVANRLRYPLLLINPQGPTNDRKIEGYYEVKDRAILVHDVALSSNHLIECISVLRAARVFTDDILTMVRHDGDESTLNLLLGENRVTMHAATQFDSRKRHAEIIEVEAASPSCVVCLIVNDSDQVPFRDLFTRAEVPVEVLNHTSGLAVFADVAPLVPGHVLIVPKTHVTCLADLSPEERNDVEGLRLRVSRIIRPDENVRTIAFEHGVCDPNHDIGCGVDHAHLHVLPLRDEEILARFHSDYQCTEITAPSALSRSVVSSSEYLLLVDNKGTGHVAMANEGSSQYFRKIISQTLGREMWNWHDEVLLPDRSSAREMILHTRSLFSSQ